MVPFAGWYMPVQYTGVIEEHKTVRNAAGLFDRGHMGQVDISGPDESITLEATTHLSLPRVKRIIRYCSIPTAALSMTSLFTASRPVMAISS